jgi:hypothetical protein
MTIGAVKESAWVLFGCGSPLAMETSLKCCPLFLRRELQISAQQVPSVCAKSLSGVEVASHLSCAVTDLERGRKAKFLELDL